MRGHGNWHEGAKDQEGAVQNVKALLPGATAAYFRGYTFAYRTRILVSAVDRGSARPPAKGYIEFRFQHASG